MTLANKTYVAILLQAVTVLTLSCGSRAGNPKKPDTTNAALPTLEFGITEVKDPDISGVEFPGGKIDTSSFSTSAPRLAKTLKALNALSIKLNSENLPIGEPFKIKANSGTLTGLVKLDESDAKYRYKSIFCVDDTPFLEVKWQSDNSNIYVQRDFNFYPFGVEENIDDMDTIVEMDLSKSKSQPKEVLDVRFQSTPEKKDLFILNAESYVDHIRYQGDGDKNVLVRGQQFWVTSGGVLEAPFTPQIQFTAKLDASGTAKVVLHHSEIKLICPQDLDSENLDNPGWCIGVSIDSTNKLSLLNKPEISAAWEGIKSIGLPVHSELRTLGIQGSCPIVK